MLSLRHGDKWYMLTLMLMAVSSLLAVKPLQCLPEPFVEIVGVCSRQLRPRRNAGTKARGRRRSHQRLALPSHSRMS
jgi:hypothetical protein